MILSTLLFVLLHQLFSEVKAICQNELTSPECVTDHVGCTNPINCLGVWVSNGCSDYDANQSYNCDQLGDDQCQSHKQLDQFCKLSGSSNCIEITSDAEKKTLPCNHQNHISQTCRVNDNTCSWIANLCDYYDINETYQCEELPTTKCESHKNSLDVQFCKKQGDDCVQLTGAEIPCVHAYHDYSSCVTNLNLCKWQVSTCGVYMDTETYKCEELPMAKCKVHQQAELFCDEQIAECKTETDANNVACNHHNHDSSTCLASPNICTWKLTSCSSYDSNETGYECQMLPESRCEFHIQPGLFCQLSGQDCTDMLAKDVLDVKCEDERHSTLTCFQDTNSCFWHSTGCKDYITTDQYQCSQLSKLTCETHVQDALFCELQSTQCVDIPSQDVECVHHNQLSYESCFSTAKVCTWSESNKCSPYDSANKSYQCDQLPPAKCEQHLGLLCHLDDQSFCVVPVNMNILRCANVNINQSKCYNSINDCVWDGTKCSAYDETTAVECSQYAKSKCESNNHSKDSGQFCKHNDVTYTCEKIDSYDQPCDDDRHIWATCLATTKFYCMWDSKCKDALQYLQTDKQCYSGYNVVSCRLSKGFCIWIPLTAPGQTGCVKITRALMAEAECSSVTRNACTLVSTPGQKCALINGKCQSVGKASMQCHSPGLNREACHSLAPAQQCVFKDNRCYIFREQFAPVLPCSAYPSSLCLKARPPFPKHMCVVDADAGCVSISYPPPNLSNVDCNKRNYGACVTVGLGHNCEWAEQKCTDAATPRTCSTTVSSYIDPRTLQCSAIEDSLLDSIHCQHIGLNEVGCMSIRTVGQSCQWQADLGCTARVDPADECSQLSYAACLSSSMSCKWNDDACTVSADIIFSGLLSKGACVQLDGAYWDNRCQQPSTTPVSLHLPCDQVNSSLCEVTTKSPCYVNPESVCQLGSGVIDCDVTQNMAQCSLNCQWDFTLKRCKVLDGVLGSGCAQWDSQLMCVHSTDVACTRIWLGLKCVELDYPTFTHECQSYLNQPACLTNSCKWDSITNNCAPFDPSVDLDLSCESISLQSCKEGTTKPCYMDPVDQRCRTLPTNRITSEQSLFNKAACQMQWYNGKCVACPELSCTKMTYDASVANPVTPTESCLCDADSGCRAKKCEDLGICTYTRVNGKYCINVNNTCQEISGCAAVTDQAQCDSLLETMHCIWNGTCQSISSCEDLTVEAKCLSTNLAKPNSKIACYWNGTLCTTVQCSTKVPADCTGLCSWNDEAGQCQVKHQSCPEFQSEDACTQGGCLWSSNSCTSNLCYLRPFEKCDGDCEVHVTRRFDKVCQTRQTQCAAINQQCTCWATNQCQWINDGCAQRPCSSILDESLCALPCQWLLGHCV